MKRRTRGTQAMLVMTGLILMGFGAPSSQSSVQLMGEGDVWYYSCPDAVIKQEIIGYAVNVDATTTVHGLPASEIDGVGASVAWEIPNGELGEAPGDWHANEAYGATGVQVIGGGTGSGQHLGATAYAEFEHYAWSVANNWYPHFMVFRSHTCPDADPS